LGRGAKDWLTVAVSLPPCTPGTKKEEGKDVKTPFRYALTLAQEGGQWKICSGMASVPFAPGTYAFPG